MRLHPASFYSSETCQPFLTVITRHFFSFFRAGHHGIHHRSVTLRAELFLRNPRKQRKLVKVRDHPIVEVFDVRDRVYDPARAEDICVLGEQGRGDDAGFVLADFEVRVGEEEEELGELCFLDVVWEELHGVCADDGDVAIGSGSIGWDGMGETESGDTILDVLGDLDPELHACCPGTVRSIGTAEGGHAMETHQS